MGNEKGYFIAINIYLRSMKFMFLVLLKVVNVDLVLFSLLKQLLNEDFCFLFYGQSTCI